MELIDQIRGILEQGAPVLVSVIVSATLIVRLTPTPKDDKVVSKIAAVVLKICSWLPTIGVNPQTKKLKEALDEAQAKK